MKEYLAAVATGVLYLSEGISEEERLNAMARLLDEAQMDGFTPRQVAWMTNSMHMICHLPGFWDSPKTEKLAKDYLQTDEGQEFLKFLTTISPGTKDSFLLRFS
jgi:hypothetical protein